MRAATDSSTSVGQGTRRLGYKWRGKAGAAGADHPAAPALPAMPLPARRRCSCFAAGGPLKQERRGADHEPESAVEARCPTAASGDVSAVPVSPLAAAATSFAKQKSGGA